MKTLVMVLCMAGAALAQQRSKQQEPPATDRAALGKTKQDPQAVDVTIKTGTEIAYDDNFLDLNNKQIKQLQDGTGAPGKFKIDKPEDFVYSVWAEIKVKGKWIGDTTHAGVKVRPYFYLSNSIANYEEYELYVRQDLGKNEAGIEYQLDQDAYLREIRHTVTQGGITIQPYDSARYMEHEIEPYYTHHLSDLFELRGSAGYRLKDFNSPFDFRDLSGFFVAAGPIVNLGKGFSAFLRYEFSDLTSEASSTEPDTSYRQHEIQIGGAIELFKNMELTLKYRMQFREYTTTNTPANDPDHADRDDLRHKVSFKARWKLSKSWAIRLEYSYWLVDSHRPFADETVTSEPGDSTRNVVSIGATFAF
jgi:opacity protein-like surface antigen